MIELHLLLAGCALKGAHLGQSKSSSFSEIKHGELQSIKMICILLTVMPRLRWKACSQFSEKWSRKVSAQATQQTRDEAAAAMIEKLL